MLTAGIKATVEGWQGEEDKEIV